MRRLIGDVDIDFADRNNALKMLEYIPASIIRNGTIVKHNTGVYFHAVPVDPITGLSSIHYENAEKQGLYKIDLLNVGVYEHVKNEQHLLELIQREFDWNLLSYPEFITQLIHIGNHADLIVSLKPRCIKDLAMVLALIRPGKRYLVEKCQTNGFSSIEDEIWLETGGGYTFHKSHATSYAILVKVHANILVEQAI